MKISREILCSTCSGTGSKDGKASKPCNECNGQGIKVMLRNFGMGMYQQIRVECPDCEGKGEIIPKGKQCADCSGKKVKSEEKEFNVEIDKGVKEGKKVVFSGESDQQPGLETGDVIFVIQEKPHHLFKRTGDDLIMEKDITLIDALSGFSFKFDHLDGRPVVVEIKQGDIIKPDDLRELPQLGMPVYTRTYEHGSIFLKFNVVFPDSLSNQQMRGLRSVFTPTPQPTAEDPSERAIAQPFDRESYARRKEEEKNIITTITIIIIMKIVMKVMALEFILAILSNNGGNYKNIIFLCVFF